MHLPYNKRLFDIVVSSGAIITLMPIMTGIAVAIKIEDPGGKVIYKSPRVGLNGLKFDMFKFRTMVSNATEIKEKLRKLNECHGAAFKITNDPRITKVGRVLRKYAFDEIPQFFNVLKGDMSIVGPRPSCWEDFAEYTDNQKKRLQIKPGMTSLWHIKGCSRDFDVQCQLDAEYINNVSLKTDLKILIKTGFIVILGHGI